MWWSIVLLEISMDINMVEIGVIIPKETQPLVYCHYLRWVIWVWCVCHHSCSAKIDQFQDWKQSVLNNRIRVSAEHNYEWLVFFGLYGN